MFSLIAISLLPLIALTQAAPSPAPAGNNNHAISSRASCPGGGPTLSYPIGNIPDGWSSASPYLILDNQNWQRTLTGRFQGGFQAGSSNSPSQCISFCQNGGWPLAGTEYGQECFCGGKRLENQGSLNLFSYQPVMNCPGSDLNCGSSDGLNLFYDYRVLSVQGDNFKLNNDPTIQSNGFTLTSKCLKETGDGGARLFKGASFSDEKMTSTKCTDFCKKEGFTQAGIEYATQCYCGDSVDLASAASSDQCNLTCGGRRTETCGGPDALTVYTAPAAAAPPPTVTVK